MALLVALLTVIDRCHLVFVCNKTQFFVSEMRKLKSRNDVQIKIRVQRTLSIVVSSAPACTNKLKQRSLFLALAAQWSGVRPVESGSAAVFGQTVNKCSTKRVCAKPAAL